MATGLLELGAVELLELGAFRRAILSGAGEFDSPSPVLNLFRMVEFMEDPYAGLLEPGEQITPRQAAIAQRLKTLSVLERKGLSREVGLSGVSHRDLIARSATLCRTLNGLVLYEIEGNGLGKGLKKKLKKVKKEAKKVAKKAVKVVKSPAFIAALGVAANLIPGAGQAISAGLLAAAAARAQYVKAKGGKMSTLDQVAGDVAPALAMSQAAGALGLGPQGAKELYNSMPSSIQALADKMVPGLKQQIQTVGVDNFQDAALKALGQSAALNSLFSGAGAALDSKLAEVLDMVKGKLGKAAEAGEQDLKNTAAASGELNAVELALSRSEDRFPWVPIAVAAGTLAGVGVILALRG